jgi:hypothetical protein
MTALYPGLESQLPTTSLTDRAIVLDLDQTLLATQDDYEALGLMKILTDPALLPLRNRTYHLTLEEMDAPGSGNSYTYWGVTRPHLQEFLVFCFSYFRIVAVWSAGKKQYVEALVKELFRDIAPPHVVFTYDDVVMERGSVRKPLRQLIDSHPVLQRHMSLSNTLALDDNSGTFIYNSGNGVLIPAYEPACSLPALARDDPSLLQFKYWLLQPEVVAAPDVTLLDKSSIFTTPLRQYLSRSEPLPFR